VFQLTATPLEAYKRLQLNIAVHRTDGIDLLKNVKSTLLPILWMQEVVYSVENITVSVLNRKVMSDVPKCRF
jgi:hypothetical protein